MVSERNAAAMVEVNAETDFVGRNEAFQGFVAAVARVALEVGEDVEALKAADYPGTGRSVAEELVQLVATIGENMTIRRARVLRVPSGVVATYVHQPLRPGLGKIGVLVALEGKSELEALEQLGRQVGMQVAASRPEFLDISAVDPAALERERAVLSEQARASGKPDAVIEKMVDGRIRKYYEEVVLLEQVWVHDGESRVKGGGAEVGRHAGRLRAVHAGGGDREGELRLRRRGRRHRRGGCQPAHRLSCSRQGQGSAPSFRHGTRQGGGPPWTATPVPRVSRSGREVERGPGASGPSGGPGGRASW